MNHNVILDKNIKAFIIYINSLVIKIMIYIVRKTKIDLLLFEKIIFMTEYLDFINFFFKKLANIFSKYIKVNIYFIE